MPGASRRRPPVATEEFDSLSALWAEESPSPSHVPVSFVLPARFDEGDAMRGATTAERVSLGQVAAATRQGPGRQTALKQHRSPPRAFSGPTTTWRGFAFSTAGRYVVN